MLRITVHKPRKSDHSYEFAIDIRHPSGTETTVPIGMHDANFVIPHAAVWDTYFPLMFITRNGGPLFAKDHSSAVVTFDYEASRPVVEFFIRRAARL